MMSNSVRIGVGLLGATILFGAMGLAQQGATDESKRRVKSKFMPAYPDFARRLNVTGKVKVEVAISADGRVKSTRVIGGHPLLVPPGSECRQRVEVPACGGRDDANRGIRFSRNK